MFYEPQLGETPLSDDNKCWSSVDHKTIKAMLVDITGKPSPAAREGMLFTGRRGPVRERHRQRRYRLTSVVFNSENIFTLKKQTKHGFHLSGKELRKQQSSSARTGWAAFFPFHEDCWTDERENRSQCEGNLTPERQELMCEIPIFTFNPADACAFVAFLHGLVAQM